MAKPLTITEDDGFLPVELPGGALVRLDVYVASDRFAQAIRDGGSDVREQAKNLAVAMQEFDIPHDLSYRLHFHIFNECKKLMEEGQKKDGLTQPAPDGLGSHGTTLDSTPTNSPTSSSPS